MKKKYFLLVLFLILAMFLSGCGGVIIVTPAINEAKVKNVINEYFLAVSNQNWSKAKNCCVYGSDRYYATCQGENLINTLYEHCNIVTINTYAEILSVSIYGNYSEAYLYVSALITACGYYDSDSSYGYYYLQKVGIAGKYTVPSL
ncbi:unnamed protein product [marine sediment metagenome]|uniref:Lipoprotein n=1 Tax=marine sediment metagenome TaxID=412755 RepID=X0YI16_9ZZZZ